MNLKRRPLPGTIRSEKVKYAFPLAVSTLSVVVWFTFDVPPPAGFDEVPVAPRLSGDPTTAPAEINRIGGTAAADRADCRNADRGPLSDPRKQLLKLVAYVSFDVVDNEKFPPPSVNVVDGTI